MNREVRNGVSARLVAIAAYMMGFSVLLMSFYFASALKMSSLV